MHEIQRLFDYWRDLMGHTRARLDDKRRRAIAARLRDGYTEDDLRLAVDGCWLSPFHMGDNKSGLRYDDLTLICRDAEHVDRFVRLAEECQDRYERMTEARRRTAEPVMAEPPVYDFAAHKDKLEAIRRLVKQRAA